MRLEYCLPDRSMCPIQAIPDEGLRRECLRSLAEAVEDMLHDQAAHDEAADLLTDTIATWLPFGIRGFMGYAVAGMDLQWREDRPSAFVVHDDTEADWLRRGLDAVSACLDSEWTWGEDSEYQLIAQLLFALLHEIRVDSTVWAIDLEDMSEHLIGVCSQCGRHTEGLTDNNGLTAAEWEHYHSAEAQKKWLCYICQHGELTVDGRATGCS